MVDGWIERLSSRYDKIGTTKSMDNFNTAGAIAAAINLDEFTIKETHETNKANCNSESMMATTWKHLS